jgi:hypothetical protein
VSADERLVGEHDLKRVAIFGLLLLALAALAVLGVRAVGKLLEPVDLAAGKPFTQSSKLADCHPEQNECAGVPTKVFFHTLEEANPWFQVDLGAPTGFSRMTIVNRSDMGEGRAVPLVVEASDDGATWRQLARRDEVFSTWKPQLGPQRARFVRLRVDRQSWLHLEAVKIHP